MNNENQIEKSEDSDELWEDVMTGVKRVEKAYTALLKASDDLAEMIGYRKEYILIRVLPRVAAERRDATLIAKWADNKRDDIEGWMKEREDNLKRKRGIKSIMEKIKPILTLEEQEILGINED